MLEMCVNQGDGLQCIGLQGAPRVIAMASHGNQQGELPLLWSLCSTLVDLGYPVAVLDATTCETPDNPGLEQLLDDACWRNDESAESLSWAVIPAAMGLQRLSVQTPECAFPLDPLSGLFQNFGVIFIYARADVVSHLLANSGIEPLLTVAPVKMSSVTAYKALKQLLLGAQLRPTIASIVGAPIPNSAMASHSLVKNLQECAMTFLDYRPDSLTVRVPQPQERPSDDIHRLALRLLENAMPLHRSHFVGSH